MPRSKNTTTTDDTTVVRPSMPFMVQWVPLGESQAHSMKFHRAQGAVSFAIERLKGASQNVEIYEHDGTGWELDTERTKSAGAKLTRGNGGALAVDTLTQHREYTIALIAQEKGTKGAEEETIREWIDNFYEACAALKVSPVALDQALQTRFAESMQGA